MKRKHVEYIINFVLALTSILFCIGAMEIALRFTSYAKLLPQKQIRSLQDHLIADPIKGFDLKKDAARANALVEGIKYDIWTNELGCFDLPYKGEKNTILLLGDSFTFGFAPFQDKWGTRIEELLSKRVLKCGVGGYGTKQETLKAADIFSQVGSSPKLVIVGYFLNDVEDDYLFPSSTIIQGYPVRTAFIRDMETGEIVRKGNLELTKEINANGLQQNLSIKKMKQWFESRLITCIMMKYSFSSLMRKVPVFRQAAIKLKIIMPNFFPFLEKPWMSNVWSAHFSNLRTLKKLADSQGASLLVVIIPYKEQVYPFLTNWESFDQERPQRLLGDFFRKEGFNYIDLLPLFRQYSRQTSHALSSEKDLYWETDPHLNIRGNHLVGLLVSRYILDNNLMPIEDKRGKIAEIQKSLGAFDR